MNKTIVTAVITAVVFGGGGYYLGSTQTQTTTSSSTTSTATRSGTTGGNFAGRGGAGRFGGAGTTFGTIIARDASSITIQIVSATSTGTTATGTKIVLYDASTQITKTTTGSDADLTVGQAVTVGGASNSDGSITAAMIQIRPATQRGTTPTPTR